LVRVARIELAQPKPRDFKSLVSTYFTILALTLEHRVRFELTTLRICNPLHLTALPSVH